MKRRIAKCVVGVCVAGMVASTPGVAFSAQAKDTASLPSRSTNTQVPSDDTATRSSVDEENIILLYGPPRPSDKLNNPLTVRAANQVVVASKVKAKSKKFAKVFTVKKAVGKVSYKKIAKGSSKNLVVNNINGTVTVKAGTKAGRYRIRVRVSAKGDDFYFAGHKDVTVTIRVK